MISIIHTSFSPSHCAWVESVNEEYSPAAHRYALGYIKPNYPVPAIRAMVNNARRLIQYGEICAENCFDISEVFERFVKL